MKEKILELLKTKFVGVSEQTLSRMAEKAAKTATSEEQAQAYVDGVNFQNVVDSEADYRATKATQTSIENYEKKYNIKEGKPVETEPEKKTDEKKDEEVPLWAKQLQELAVTLTEERKKQSAKTAREALIEKVISLGAKADDRKHIESLVDMAGVDGATDVEEKATAILSVYNSFKTPPKTKTPDKTDDDVDDDKFASLLKEAKGEEAN